MYNGETLSGYFLTIHMLYQWTEPNNTYNYIYIIYIFKLTTLLITLSKWDRPWITGYDFLNYTFCLVLLLFKIFIIYFKILLNNLLCPPYSHDDQ